MYFHLQSFFDDCNEIFDINSCLKIVSINVNSMLQTIFFRRWPDLMKSKMDKSSA